MKESYLNKIIIFDYSNGCIPEGSVCYCYSVQGDYAWVTFKNTIFGRNDLKLHVDVIVNHGRVVSE